MTIMSIQTVVKLNSVTTFGKTNFGIKHKALARCKELIPHYRSDSLIARMISKVDKVPSLTLGSITDARDLLSSRCMSAKFIQHRVNKYRSTAFYPQLSISYLYTAR